MKCNIKKAGRQDKAALPAINPDETADDLDAYKIIQRKKGYRFSEDSIILADFVLPLKSTDSVIDLGTGSGIIPLILARKSPVKNIVGMEIQEGLAEIANRNMELNGLSSRIKIIKGDFRDIISGRRMDKWRGSFSVVICNPPYTQIVSGRMSPCQEKATAKMEIACTLPEIVMASRYLMTENGRIVYIYPVVRLQAMLAAIKANALEIKRLEYVLPKAGCKTKRFLIEIGCVSTKRHFAITN